MSEYPTHPLIKSQLEWFELNLNANCPGSNVMEMAEEIREEGRDSARKIKQRDED